MSCMFAIPLKFQEMLQGMTMVLVELSVQGNDLALPNASYRVSQSESE